MHSLIRQSHWIIFSAGIAVTCWAAYLVDQQIDRQARAAFELRALNLQVAVSRQFRSYEDILFSIAGLFSSSGKVDPKEFDRFGDALNIKERYPALQALNFAKYFPAQDRKQFLSTFNQDTEYRNANRQISLSEGRTEYMVLTRAYPKEMSAILGNEILQTSVRPIPGAVKTTNLFSGSEYLANHVISSGLPLRPPIESAIK